MIHKLISSICRAFSHHQEKEQSYNCLIVSLFKVRHPQSQSASLWKGSCTCMCNNSELSFVFFVLIKVGLKFLLLFKRLNHLNNQNLNKKT